MSHFVTNVILPKNKKPSYGLVEDMLLPYSELDSTKEYWKEALLETNDEGEPYEYNPEGYWDWFRVGGRWNGYIVGKPRNDEKGGFNFEDEFESLRENSCLVKDITKDKDGRYPYAIITPDGEWHSQGTMGWFGCSTDDKEQKEWEKEIESIYKQYKEHYVVSTDCHI